MLLMKIEHVFLPDHYLCCLSAPFEVGPRECYALLAVSDLSAEHYQPLIRGEVVELPYTGKLYTHEEVEIMKIKGSAQ